MSNKGQEVWPKVRKMILAFVMAAIMATIFLHVCPAQQLDPTLKIDGLNTVSDVIVGRGSKGPYHLSWSDIVQDSITIVVNGRTLKRGSEYQVDPVKGIVSFSSNLASDAIARVSYRIQPGKSRQLSGNTSIPINLSLINSQDTSLQFTGLYSDDDPNKPNSGKTILGLGAGKKWGFGSFNSQFLLSQKNNSDASDNKGGTWDNSALKLGADTAFGGLKITGSYLHAGEHFSGGKEYGVGQGKDVVDLQAIYSPDSRLQFNAKYFESEDTAGQTKGAKSAITEQAISYNPSDSTALSLRHTSTETATSAIGSERKVDTSVANLSHKLNENTKASFTLENTRIDSGSLNDEVNTRKLSLISSAFHKTLVSALLTQKESKLYGDENGMEVSFATQPNQQVKVEGTVSMLENNNVGDQKSADVKVTASPIKQVAVQAAVSTADSTKLGDSTKTSVSIQAKPLENVEVKGTLVGSSQNDSEQYQKDITMTSVANKYTKVTAAISQKAVNNWDDVTKAAMLELTPYSHTKLAAGYKYIEAGSRIMTIKDYIASTAPIKFLSLSGSFRDREAIGESAFDSMSLQLSLKPFDYFTLTGSLQENPEDQKGIVQTYRSTSMGFNTKLGSFGLTTTFSEKDEYLANRISDERGISLEMPFFRAGRLITGYKQARLLDSSELATRTYSLGYRHSIGSDFSLSITGYFSQQYQDKMRLKDREEYNASIGLGLNF